MKRSKRKDNRGAFTLLEILVVIVVIVILAAMVFNIGGIVSNKNEIARTRKIVEATANAIEEYSAEYGSYPQVPDYPGIGQPVRYEYAFLQSPDPATPDKPILDAATAQQIRNASADKNIWEDARMYTFGLVSFIFPRYIGHATVSAPPGFLGTQNVDDLNDPDKNLETYKENQAINQWKDYNHRGANVAIGDLPRDISASRRMVQHLEASLDENGRVVSYGLVRAPQLQDRSYGTKRYTNKYITIEDAWGRELRYQSYPPYKFFKVWSVGPDGPSGTTDDIIAGQE